MHETAFNTEYAETQRAQSTGLNFVFLRVLCVSAHSALEVLDLAF